MGGHCHTDGMSTTIDAAGRLVIPKQVRERLGLTAGAQVEITEVGDHLELRPAGRRVRVEEVDGRLIAQADGDAPVLTADEVRRLVETDRR